MNITQLIFTTLSAVFIINSAQAATIEFIYQGQSFFCPEGGDQICQDYDGTPGFEGSITIDSDLYPLASVGGTTLEITYDLLDNYGGGDTLSVSVSNGSDSFNAQIVSPQSRSFQLSQTDPRFAFLSYDGIIGGTLFGIVAPSPSVVWIEIATDLSIKSWRFDGGLQGGSNDFASFPSGDFFASGAVSRGPGNWTVLVDGEPIPVTPVPLPASSLLLLAGVCALMAMRSFRRIRYH